MVIYLIIFNQINCKSMDNWHKIQLPWPFPQTLSGISHPRLCRRGGFCCKRLTTRLLSCSPTSSNRSWDLLPEREVPTILIHCLPFQVLIQHTVPHKWPISYSFVIDTAYFLLIQSCLVVYSNCNSILFNNVYHIQSWDWHLHHYDVLSSLEIGHPLCVLGAW